MAWLTGYPREKINWHPTIDPEKCVECGMCMNCGREVYNWAEDGPKVERPLDCIVGCTTCANLCMGKAIAFPDIETVRSCGLLPKSLFYRKNSGSRLAAKATSNSCLCHK
jgi:MinD superfamily P-loop ATPase